MTTMVTAETWASIPPSTQWDDLEDSWRRVDLRPTLDGELEPIVPTLLRRDDGRALFYAGQANGLHGDDGTGKSWVAAIMTAQELKAGHHVGWINLEDPTPQVVVERLRLLGVDDTTIDEQLHYFGPTVAFDDLPLEYLEHEARAHAFSLIVIDSLGEAFGLDGIDENLDRDVAPWLRRVVRRLAETGSSILTIDHGTKAADNPLHPSGSKRKRAAITGASYLVEAPSPLTIEHGGRLRLTCAKDRHGHYRRGEAVADIDFHVYPDGGLSVKVWPPSLNAAASSPAGKLRVIARAAVRTLKDADEPLSQRRLLERMNVRAKHETKKAAIEEAIAAGAIRVEDGARGMRQHIYVHDLTDDTEAAS